MGPQFFIIYVNDEDDGIVSRLSSSAALDVMHKDSKKIFVG